MLAKDIFEYYELNLKELNNVLELYEALKAKAGERFYDLKIEYSFETVSNGLINIELKIDFEDEVSNIIDLIHLFEFINKDEKTNKSNDWITDVIEFYAKDKNLFRSNQIAKLMYIALNNPDIIKVNYIFKELDIKITLAGEDAFYKKEASLDLEKQITSLAY